MRLEKRTSETTYKEEHSKNSQNLRKQWIFQNINASAELNKIICPFSGVTIVASYLAYTKSYKKLQKVTKKWAGKKFIFGKLL